MDGVSVTKAVTLLRGPGADLVRRRVGGWFLRDGSEEGLDGSTGAPPSQEAWHLRPSAARRLSEKKLQHVLAQKWNNLRFTANLNSK